jgi:hypothetical protein
MANTEHLKILNEGVGAWNEWRVATRLIHPDLSDAELSGAKLYCANLSGADLSRTCLMEAELSDADLLVANLFGADLSGATLRGADLSGANLSSANLSRAFLFGANLSGADLSDANLSGANLSGAGLSGANLNHAKLYVANLSGSFLENTLFSKAYLNQTTFTFTSLKTAKGLESCHHHGRSAIDYHTLMESGPLPEVFLRGCGLSDEFIRYLPEFWNQPIRIYSCFISFSTQDEEFASRLHNDFQSKGIRCWKWNHDALTGRSLWGEIDQAIRVYDKLLLIASESSLKSPAVNREIERALVQEDERLKRKLAGDVNVDSDVLFPVRIDDFLFDGWEHERKVDVIKKVIADARGWDKNTAVYACVRDRLIRDLKRKSPEPCTGNPAQS